jgi:hypothetical protein
MANTDPALWTVRRRFGAAGGPDEVVLTEEGAARAFSVGAQVRRGPAADALLALWQAAGEGFLCVRRPGTNRLELTTLGRFDQVAWGHLRSIGYVESILPDDDHGDGVRLTDRGKAAAWNGIQERERLLERCKLAEVGHGR